MKTEKSTILETYNMFNCDKVKNNEAQGYLFFTPMSRSGAIFFALAPYTVRNHIKSYGNFSIFSLEGVGEKGKLQ